MTFSASKSYSARSSLLIGIALFLATCGNGCFWRSAESVPVAAGLS
jgi:hypothetical protein